MEITKTITVTLTPEEVTQILKDHFKAKNIEIDHIYYDVNGVYGEDDYGGHPTYKLTKIKCEGNEKVDNDKLCRDHFTDVSFR